ncbi:MAG: Rieske (2Fe-2S) protein, partial [Chthoniobacterales bacterium]
MPSNAPSAFRKTTETFTAGARTLPQRYFVSPEAFAEEQARIFGQQWICVGHQSQIVRAGDFFVQEVAGESLVIVRDKSDQVRGYFNVCRHRGTRLCEDAAGHAAAIQCPYHAWTYGLDGRLIGAPHMDAVPGFEKGDYSLHAVNLGLWEGFIFVSLAEEPTPLAEFFAPLEAKFSH